MRSCKTLRRAQLGLKTPLRSTLARDGAVVTRFQHILASHENPSENGGAAESNWTTLALKIGLFAVASFVGAVTVEKCDGNGPARCDFDEECGVHYETGQHFTNWSSTVNCTPERVYEPKNAQEVVRVLKTHHDSRLKIRPIGQALSPNGLGMSDNDVISLSAIDYVEVDRDHSLVTVGAGAKVSTVLSELKKVGLTLQNFSSIQEQQIGGWMQVAAHGTGVSLPTVEEMIVNMKMATPTEGLITLSNTANPRLFSMAKVGLGSLGVVTEMTLQCIPQMNLLEQSSVCDRKKMNIKDHIHRLKTYRHVRYMWVPYTDTVVTVVSNPSDIAVGYKDDNTGTVNDDDLKLLHNKQLSSSTPSALPTKPLSDLLLSLDPSLDPTQTSQLSFSQLRDQLLGIAPLDLSHIKKVNTAEAEFWKASQGTRLGDSTDILGFDCGGEQLVMEFCFPIGTLEELNSNTELNLNASQGAGNKNGMNGKDIAFVEKLLTLVERAGIPAPSPIEQRWTASSSACMSPAYAENAEDKQIFSWVGVIMYLPPNQTDEQRTAIKSSFEEYLELIQPLLEEYDAHAHWAKIALPAAETPAIPPPLTSENTPWYASFIAKKESSFKSLPYDQKVLNIRSRLATRYPLKEFNAYRGALDPYNIYSNKLIDVLISPEEEQ